MFNQYRMVLLGMIVAQGVNLSASETPKTLSNSGKKVVAAAVIVAQEKNKSPLSCSAEVREKRDLEGSRVCCGPAKRPYYGIPHSIVPHYEEHGYASLFPGAGYNPLNFK